MSEFKLVEVNDLPLGFDNVPFTQAPFYGQWQKKIGRTVKSFVIYQKTEAVAYFQLICYSLPLGKKYVYIPYGPIITKSSSELFLFIKTELKKIAKDLNGVFVRLDFTLDHKPEKSLFNIFYLAPHYTYHSAYFQPRFEWILRLDTKPADLMLLQMDKDTRYSIRLAERKEIKTEIITNGFEKYFDVFYELMIETAKRNHFHLHSKVYYQNIFNDLKEIKDSYLVIARYKDKILAINLIIVYQKVANYVFAASSDQERNRAPAYLAQWTGIIQAQKIGCKIYNFGGIATEKDKHHQWDGLTFFKKKFGGEELRHSDFYDIVINPVWYLLYCLRRLFLR